MIVYHASNHLFSKPNIEKIWQNRTNHDNGQLGLWCAVRKDWIKSFGKYTYEIEISDKSLNININEFSKKCQAKPNYREWRNNLLKDYDNLCIVENSGKIDMLIILNLESIKKFNLMQ